MYVYKDIRVKSADVYLSIVEAASVASLKTQSQAWRADM